MTTRTTETLADIKWLESELLAARARLDLVTANENGITVSEIEVAKAVHTADCKWNHTDGCDWFYGENDWTEYSHVRYLKIAREMLKQANGNADLIIAIVNALKVR